MATADVVVEAFTDLAPNYEDTMDGELRRFWGLSYEEFIERLVGLVSVHEGDLILDVATGTARIPRRLAGMVQARGRIVGLDITPAMLAQGQKNVKAASASTGLILMVCASAMDLPFPEDVFDVVICGLGTHHCDVPRMLSEMRRVLRAGGKLVLADVGASAFWRSLWGRAILRVLLAHYRLTRGRARAQAESEAFPNVRTAGEWRALLSSLGFTGIEILESPARRPWYPCALTMRAVTEGI
jgi:ubiquinone/menaquinone biosynthesis C-methylase UbiE